jgi:hypothetical protein
MENKYMPIPQELIPFDPKHIKLIRNVLTIAEQGTQTIPYGKVEVMNDGPGDKAQVTLSIGFTEYGGNLKRVLARYVDRGRAFSCSDGCLYSFDRKQALSAR